MAKRMKQLEEHTYAQEVQGKARQEQEREEAERQRAKERQREYLNSLNDQLIQRGIKKRYDSLMTEHERRVNDKDIQAFEVADTKNLYGKLPGFRSHEQDLQNKYLEKMFQNNGGAQMPNPT